MTQFFALGADEGEMTSRRATIRILPTTGGAMRYPRKLVMVTVAGVAAVSAVSAAGAGGFGYNHDSQQSSGVVKVTYDNPQGWTLAENGYSVFVPGGPLGDKSLQIKGQAGGTVVCLPSSAVRRASGSSASPPRSGTRASEPWPMSRRLESRSLARTRPTARGTRCLSTSRQERLDGRVRLAP